MSPMFANSVCSVFTYFKRAGVLKNRLLTCNLRSLTQRCWPMLHDLAAFERKISTLFFSPDSPFPESSQKQRQYFLSKASSKAQLFRSAKKIVTIMDLTWLACRLKASLRRLPKCLLRYQSPGSSAVPLLQLRYQSEYYRRQLRFPLILSRPEAGRSTRFSRSDLIS